MKTKTPTPQSLTLSALERFALEVALLAPEVKNKWAKSAQIPWSLVDDIRTQVESYGIDWRTLKKTMVKRP